MRLTDGDDEFENDPAGDDDELVTERIARKVGWKLYANAQAKLDAIRAEHGRIPGASHAYLNYCVCSAHDCATLKILEAS